MRKPSNDLHRLIRSLTRQEKGCFKRFARARNGAGDNDYLVLFDAVNAMKTYDEKALIAKLSHTPLVKNLAWSKHNLYELILKALRSYDQGSSSVRIRNHMHDSAILKTKALHDLAAKSLGAARKTALRHENYPALMEINRMELLPRAHDSVREAEAKLRDSYDELADYMAKYGNSCAYHQLASEVFLNLAQEGTYGPERVRIDLKRAFNNPLIQSEKNALTFESRWQFNLVRCKYFYSLGEYEQAYVYLKRNKELFAGSPAKIQDLPLGYINALHNLIVLQLNLKRFHEVPEGLKEIRALRFGTYGKGPADSATALELRLHTYTGHFLEGIAVYKSVKNRLKEVRQRSPLNHLTIIYYGALSYFGCCRFNEAARLLEVVINDSMPGFRTDFQASARIVKLICHYESGDTDLLPYVVKSTYRYLKGKDRLTGVERAVVDFLQRDLPRVPFGSESNLIASLVSLKKQLVDLTKDPVAAMSLDYFDFISWIESKVERRSFAQIVQEKARPHLSVANA